MARKIAGALVGVLLLASCGRHQDAAVTVEAPMDAHALAASADQTVQAGTGTVHLTMTMAMHLAGSEAAGIPTSFDMTGDGAYDTAAQQSTMTVDLGSDYASLLARLPGAPAAANTEQVVRDGSILYLNMPLLAMTNPAAAGKWIKVDTSAAPGAASSLSGSSSSATTDPTAFLDYLKGAGADLTTVGHEQIDGSDTTHLQGSLSMKQALDASGADRAKIEASLQQLGGGEALESLTFPVDVYVDGAGYVRRISLTEDLSGVMSSLAKSMPTASGNALSGSTMKATITLDYSNFGQPVTIDVPAADQTISMCDVVPALHAGLGC